MCAPIRLVRGLCAAALLLASALAPISTRAASGLTRVPRMMNFFPEPEEGGEYAAEALGIYMMKFDVDQSRPLIMGGDAARGGIGTMTMARWATLKQQLVSVGIALDKVDVSKAFTTQFLH